jgi:hypothetical protein
MESKIDFESLKMIETILFLLQILTGSFFVARHRRRLPFPRHRVEGHRHHRQRADSSRFKRFRTSVQG